MSPAPRDSDAYRQEVRAHVARYVQADDRLAAAHLVVALALAIGGVFWVLPALASWTDAAFREGTWVLAGLGLLGCLLVGLALSGTYIKLFMLHHDLCHGAHFSGPRTNRWLALVAGTMVSTTPSTWRREHDFHHAHSNDLDHKQDGQTAPWTLAEYRAASPWTRRAYRVLNEPRLLYSVIPPLYFFGFMRVTARWHENLAFAAFVAALIWADVWPFYLATFIPTAMFGFVVFHLQHTFDGVYKRRGQAWDFLDNGLRGSSYLQVPRRFGVGPVLRFFFNGVAYHHVHHLHPGIPGYRLRACHHDGEALFRDVPRVTFAEACRTTAYALYDEEDDRLLRWRDVRLG